MARRLYSKRGSIDNQINNIVSNVSEIFIRDSKNIITLDFEKLLNELKNIQDELNLVQKFYTNSKGKQYSVISLKRSNIKQRQLLLKGYLILQNFRAYLTGNLVDYRYYIETKDGHVSMVSLSEEELLKYLIIGLNHGIETGFILSGSLNTLSKNIEHSLKEQLFLEHFDNLYNSIMTEEMQPGYSYGYMVHSFIIDKYGSEDNKTPPNLWNKKGRYQQFNRGHIFEGIDISMYEAGANMLSENPVLNYMKIKELFYTKNLVYENVSGFKGGDNTFTNTQIKSQGADLMDYNTIYKQIENLYSILQTGNAEELKQKLFDTFIDTTEKAIDIEIDDIIVNDLLEGFKKYSNKS